MATKTIKKWTKTEHCITFFLGNKGDTTFNFTIPSGWKYKNAELNVLGGRYHDGAIIKSQPSPGATGSQKIVVHWWFDGGSNPTKPPYIKYELKVIAETVPQRAILVAIENQGRAGFINYLPKKLKAAATSLVDSLMETSAKVIAHALFDNEYDKVVILEDAKCTKEEIKENIINLGKKYILDFAIECHGGNGFIELHEDKKLYESEVIGWIGSETANLKLRLVYQMNCKGSTFNDTWCKLGFKTSIGSKGNNNMPEPMFTLFWTYWKRNMKARQAAIKAWEDASIIYRAVYPPTITPHFVPLPIPHFDFTYKENSLIVASKPVTKGNQNIKITDG